MTGLYQDAFIAELKIGVKALLPDWRIDSESELSLICLSENATFKVKGEDGEGDIIIRVHRPEYHQRQEIWSELSWIEALQKEGVINTASIVSGRNNDSILSFEQDGKQRFVVAFESLPGIEPDESSDLESGFRQLGSITADLHRHSRGWERPADFVRKKWTFETMIGSAPYWGSWHDALGLKSDGRSELQRCCDLLEQQLDDYGEGNSRFGLIHADLRLANLLMSGERLSVIDFDDCGFSWFLYDFAAAISFIETSPQIPQLLKSWVEGYRKILPLSDEEVAYIPMFIMLRRILLTAWVASHSETPTAQSLGTAYTDGTIQMATQYLRGESRHWVGI